MSGKTGGGDKAAQDNRANQLNPNNDAYRSSRDHGSSGESSSNKEQ